MENTTIAGILILCSLMLAVMSAWSLNTFIRLNNARKTYNSGDAFEDATHISPLYCKGGLIIASVMLVVSVGIFATTLYQIRSYLYRR